MVCPLDNETETRISSRYSLVIAVAKRAKQLREGAPALVECKSKNLITIALEEIASGKIKIIVPTLEEIEADRVETAGPPRVSAAAEAPSAEAAAPEVKPRKSKKTKAAEETPEIAAEEAPSAEAAAPEAKPRKTKKTKADSE